MSSFVFISFRRLSCCIKKSSHVPFILHYIYTQFPFILLSCPFMFRRLSKKKRSWKADMLKPGNRWLSTPSRPRFFMSLIVIVELSFWRPVQVAILCHLQASWTCACIRSLSCFNSYRFLGRQCIGSVKVQAKLKWNARGYSYYTIPCVVWRSPW